MIKVKQKAVKMPVHKLLSLIIFFQIKTVKKNLLMNTILQMMKLK